MMTSPGAKRQWAIDRMWEVLQLLTAFVFSFTIRGHVSYGEMCAMASTERGSVECDSLRSHLIMISKAGMKFTMVNIMQSCSVAREKTARNDPREYYLILRPGYCTGIDMSIRSVPHCVTLFLLISC